MSDIIPGEVRKKRILVTGITGLAGWNIYQYLRGQDCDVYGVSRYALRETDPRCFPVALENEPAAREMMARVEPDIIIHTQARCNLDVCEKDPVRTHTINVKATEVLLSCLNPSRHTLVYLSSDHVFSGDKGNYTENDCPDPVSVYGKTRALAEALALAYPGTLLVRPGLIIGRSMQENIGALDWLCYRTAKGMPVSYFEDEYRSPISARVLAAGILFLLQKNAAGIYHLAGKTRYSRFQLAKHLAACLGIFREITPRRREDDKIVPRIGNATLNCAKAAALGWPVPPILDEDWKSPPSCPLCGCKETSFFCTRNDSGSGERHYFKCPVCALIFLLPAQRLSLEAEKSRYDFHQNNPADAGYLDFLSQLAEPLSLRLPKGAAGLDFGCGPGPAMSGWFRERGFTMEDYDPIYRPRLPLLEQSYDFITCTETAEHFYHPRREFLLLDRLLKPGSFLGVMTFILEEESRFADWWYPSDTTHVCFYQPRTLQWIAAWREWTLEIRSAQVAIFHKPVESGLVIKRDLRENTALLRSN